MPVFKAKLFTFDIRAKEFHKTLDADVRRQIRQAARAFVRVAVASVPFRTGFARGTFKNILEAMGDTSEPSISGPVGDLFTAFRAVSRALDRPHLGLRPPPGAKREYYYHGKTKVLKTPQSGRQFATPRGEIFGFASNVYTFNFNVFITYFNINDFFPNKRTPSAPWGSFARGRALFLQYMRTEALKKLPRINDFLIETEVSTNGTRITRKKSFTSPIFRLK